MDKNRQKFIEHCIRYRVSGVALAKFLGVSRQRACRIKKEVSLLLEKKTYCDICCRRGDKLCHECKELWLSTSISLQK